MTKIAREATVQGLAPLKIKKIYVLAGLLVSPTSSSVYMSLHRHLQLVSIVRVCVQIEEYHSHTKQAQQKAKAEMGSSGDRKGEVGSKHNYSSYVTVIDSILFPSLSNWL